MNDQGLSANSVCTGSILFTDLVGFTDFTDAIGDTAALGVLERQSQLVNETLTGLAGARVVKELGDGLMIWFPQADTGLRTATALLVLFDEARSTGEFPLAMRMGLHHGDAIPRGDDLVGHAVNVAARVSDLAGPGELLVSENALNEIDRSEWQEKLTAIGPVIVKGVSDPIWLSRVTA